MNERLQSGDSPRVSEILTDFIRTTTGERIYLGDFVDALGARAFGLLQFVFSLPNAAGLGAVPGLSTIFGLPQLVLAAQMILGLHRPWLPGWLQRRSLARQDLVTLLVRSMPYLMRVERVLRPRFLVLSSDLAERLLGIVFLILALIVSLPIPFANQLPAIAMALLALGLIERDGLYVTIGLLVALVSVAIAAAVIIGGVAVIFLILHHVFGGG